MIAALQPAYVLHVRRYSESSLIVEFFTRDFGRIAALARGVLKNKKTQNTLLQPFIPLMITCRGRGELPILTTVESMQTITYAKGRALYCGLYINELMMRLTGRTDPYPALFTTYVEAMVSLLQSDRSNQQLEPILRYFEFSLIQELGFGLCLTHDQNGSEIEAGEKYHYDMQQGLRLAGNARLSLSGDSLNALASSSIVTEQQRLETRQLMRKVLSFYLGNKPLKSRELFI